MIYLGADHGGYSLKNNILHWLKTQGYQVRDLGNYQLDKYDDYPRFAQKVAQAVQKNPQRHRGILFCRTGVGMALVANKFKGVKAAVATDLKQVKQARLDEGINILTIAADYTPFLRAKRYIRLFLTTPFSNLPRHRRRLKELKKIEQINFR